MIVKIQSIRYTSRDIIAFKLLFEWGDELPCPRSFLFWNFFLSVSCNHYLVPLLCRKPWGHCGMLLFLRKNSVVWYLSSGRKWVGKEKIPLQTSGIHQFYFYLFIISWVMIVWKILWLLFCLFFHFSMYFIDILFFRGGGFISLENLLYFARNFPVCHFSSLSLKKERMKE